MKTDTKTQRAPCGIGEGLSDSRRNMKLTSEEWHDVADLCEQGAYLAADAGETHKYRACDKTIEWFNKLAMKATRYALNAEENERKIS